LEAKKAKERVAAHITLVSLKELIVLLVVLNGNLRILIIS